jgi:PAS domain S-box-containing protein
MLKGGANSPMQRPNSETGTLKDILMTEELSRRSPHTTKWQAQAEAMQRLIHQMAQDSDSLLQTLVDTALELCTAGTTGVSLLETTPEGAEIFRWNALAGTLANYVGGITPRNFSPCSVCLDQGAPVLFSHPEHYFTYFQDANTPIVEGLVLPLIADHHVFGTIWILSHDEDRQFDSEDVRVMTSLADFTATALLLQQRQTRELLAANAALEAEIVERKQAQEQSRALIANLPGGAVFVVDRDLRYLLAEGEALAITGFKPEDFMGRTIFEVLPADLAGSYEPMYRQALAGESFEDEHYAHNHWYISRGTPLYDDQDEIYAVLVVSYDITDRKCAEAALRESQERQTFLLKLSDALRPLADPVEIQATLTRTAMNHFGADRCYYCEIEDGNAIIRRDAAREDLPTVAGVYPLSRFAILQSVIEAGRPFVVQDIHTTDTVDDDLRQLCIQLQVISFIDVPVIKNGKPVGVMCLVQSTPRDWTDLEVELAIEMAERTWAEVERAYTEQSLRTSEAKYRSLFTSINEGCTLLEMISEESGHPTDFRIVETNPAWEQQTGLTNAAGKTLLEITPNFEPQLLDFYGDVVISGRARRTEYYTAAVDRWYTVYASRIGGEESHQIAVVFNDISDRKRRERQQEFLLNFSDYLRTLADEKTIEENSLRLLAEFLRLDRAYIFVLYESEDRAVVRAEHRKNNLASMLGEVRMSDFPETVRQIEKETLVVNDIDSDATLSDLNRTSLAAVNLQAFVCANVRKGERNVVWSLAASTTVPRTWTKDEVELIETVAERMWAAVERAKAEIALRELELQRVREQSEREQERQRAESLAELDRTKTLFFSNISHEFRTPLTLSLAPLQDALSDPTLADSQRERLELIHRNSLRLLKLVNTLLDFSRIEAGRMEAVYEPADLALFTTELTGVFRSAIEQAGLQLIVDCPPLPEPVYVDREMWEKIVLNLLSNAFKFTFEGAITVRLHSADDNQVILQIQDTGTGIAPEHLPHLFERFYQIRDTQARTYEGSGIGLALVHELVRLHNGTIEVSSRLGEGTCFTITLPFGTEHLPSARLQDEGEHQPVRTLASTAIGAASYVEEAQQWVPVVDFSQPSLERGEKLDPPQPPLERGENLLKVPLIKGDLGESSGAEADSTSSALVLVVDDNADMREYLTRLLSEHFQVEAVADGATALAVAQERLPDLILSDVMMPGLDGFEFLQALRADPRIRAVPILLLSARAGEEVIVEGLEAGADDYLIKPFSAQELVSRVKAHLQMAQLRGEALQEARSKIRSRDELISVVSHELNTPLVSILGWTRMLRTHPPSPVMLSKALDIIERNAMLEAKLVQDLLDLSRISAGKLRLHLQPIELQSVIETVIATVAQTATDQGIELTWQENVTEPVIVMGDGDRLGQVLINLLTNAIKFTPEAGRVTLELSVTNRDDSSDSAGAEIRVSDTGIGIALDFLPHVFDRFRQAEGANAAKGLGLGLAISRHIVELHNGTIHAESAGAGQGATFIVRLPLHTSTTTEPPSIT